MKITVTAEVRRQYAPFVRRKLRDVAQHLDVAWASRPIVSAKAAGRRERSGKMPKPLKAALRELSVVLVNDKRISALHQQFMNIPRPTDVLTFPIDTDAQGRVTSGEIYVCVPHARREAKARGVETKHEVLLYALHGMLHLLGYDDRTAAAFRTMHRVEDEILTQIGIGPVFARASRASRTPRASRTSRGGAR